MLLRSEKRIAMSGTGSRRCNFKESNVYLSKAKEALLIFPWPPTLPDALAAYRRNIKQVALITKGNMSENLMNSITR